jgi:hypothetical protein
MAWIKSMKAIDFQDPDASNMLDLLVNFELISNTNKQEILAMADKTLRWADYIGLNLINSTHLIEARAL